MVGTVIQPYTSQVCRVALVSERSGWHLRSSTPGFWIHKDFQDRLVWLWTEVAKHYKDNPWVAGYNPMNEPADPHGTTLIRFYDRVHEAIRSVDAKHILFLDGNTYSIDFSAFPNDAKERWENTAYAIHDVSFPRIDDMRNFLISIKVCNIWVPGFASLVRQVTGTDRIDEGYIPTQARLDGPAWSVRMEWGVGPCVRSNRV